MRAALLTAPRDLAVVDVEPPIAGRGEVVVRVRVAALCGSDLLAYQGVSARYGFPRVIGHEVAGTVVEAGEGVDTALVGAEVVVDPNLSCGACGPCSRGLVNLCEERLMLGETMAVPGGCAELVKVPAANCHVVGDDWDPVLASLVQPLAICHHALLSRGRLVAGERVVVFGGGAVGIGCAMVALAVGAEVAIVEPRAERRGVAEASGVHLAVPPTPEGLAAIREWAGGSGADVVVEAVGGPQEQTIRDAVGLAGRRGRVVVLGEFAAVEVPTLVRDLKKRELDIVGSVGHPDAFEPVIDLLGRGLLRPMGLVSHRLPLEDAARAMELLDDPESGAIKVVVTLDA